MRLYRRHFKAKRPGSKTSKVQKLQSAHVCKLLNGEFKSETEHDESFLCTVRDVCNAVNENAENDYFTFGNAQKLINMSAKYAYTICLADPTYRERFRFCHCPMDLGMLDKVWYMHKGKFNEKRLGSHDSFCSSWSTETAEDQTFPDRYNKFQQAVKDIIANTEIYPIEFDYFEWGKDFQKKQSQNE